jgi:hypothetical protein
VVSDHERRPFLRLRKILFSRKEGKTDSSVVDAQPAHKPSVALSVVGALDVELTLELDQDEFVVRYGSERRRELGDGRGGDWEVDRDDHGGRREDALYGAVSCLRDDKARANNLRPNLEVSSSGIDEWKNGFRG